jgi:pentatricopeptide repeat protein
LHRFIRLKEQNVPLNTAIYNSYMTVCAGAKNADEAFAALEEMKQNNIARDLGIYNTLVNACVKSKQLAKAFSVLPMMMEENFIPSSVCKKYFIRDSQKSQDYFHYTHSWMC